MAVAVRIGDRSFEVGADDQFTFGRSTECTLCLDPDDTGISRLAGTVERDGDTWWLVNHSGVRALSVIDDLGFRNVLPPGRRIAVESPVRVVVAGSKASHTLTIAVPPRPETTKPAALPTDDPPTEATDMAASAGIATAMGESVLVSDADRLAMVALFAGYLHEPPRHDPYPKSYAAAAARLGWPRTTLVKRIEHLRIRLTNAGVPNLTGWNALTHLAEYALTTGLIGKEDLRRLTRPAPPPQG